MTPHSHQDQEEQYRDVLDQLTAEHTWLLSDATPVGEAVSRATGPDHGVGELHFTHALTDARLYVRFPDLQGDNLMRLTMYHPLFTGAPDADEGFVGSLAEAHRTVAAIYGSDYIQPVADPTVILHGVVPRGYSESGLSSMLTAISAVALRVQRLHDDIERPVTEVLGTSDHPSNDSSFDCVA